MVTVKATPQRKVLNKSVNKIACSLLFPIILAYFKQEV